MGNAETMLDRCIYWSSRCLKITDRGTNFTSKFVQTACALNGVKLITVPVEAPWRVGKIERAHVALKSAYSKTRRALPKAPREEVLSSAIKAVNDAVGSSGISPTLAAFGAQARYHAVKTSAHVAKTNAERMEAIESARQEIEKYYRGLDLKHVTKSHAKSNVRGCFVPLEGDRVLGWRKDRGWEGPCTVIHVSNTTDVTVRNDSTGKETTMEQSQVMPYYGDHQDYDKDVGNDIPNLLECDVSDDEDEPDEEMDVVLGEVSEMLETDVIPPSPENAERFRGSRKAELGGLLEAEVFGVMRREDVPKGKRIFKRRFIDAVKNKGTTPELDKSRYVL